MLVTQVSLLRGKKTIETTLKTGTGLVRGMKIEIDNVPGAWEVQFAGSVRRVENPDDTLRGWKLA